MGFVVGAAADGVLCAALWLLLTWLGFSDAQYLFPTQLEISWVDLWGLQTVASTKMLPLPGVLWVALLGLQTAVQSRMLPLLGILWVALW